MGTLASKSRGDFLMSIYCFCDNLYEGDNCDLKKDSSEVRLTLPMKCIKTGAMTFISYADENNVIHEQRHKNADIFECPRCKRKIAKE